LAIVIVGRAKYTCARAKVRGDAAPRNFARARVYFARPTIGIAKIRVYSQSKRGLTSEKLQEDDLELIEVLKVHYQSISLSQITEELVQFGAQQISMLAVSRTIKFQST